MLAAPRCPGRPTRDLPDAADQAKQSRRKSGGGWPEELTLKPHSKSPRCWPRSADRRRRNVDQFLHDRGTLLPVALPDSSGSPYCQQVRGGLGRSRLCRVVAVQAHGESRTFCWSTARLI